LSKNIYVKKITK